MTNDQRQQRRERMGRGATDFAESLVAYCLGEVQHTQPAPAPAVIETPEEVAERVIRKFSETDGEEEKEGDCVRTLSEDIAYAIRTRDVAVWRTRDAAHAAQLAQTREAALDEAAKMLGVNGYDVCAREVRNLKARPVAAGGT